MLNKILNTYLYFSDTLEAISSISGDIYVDLHLHTKYSDGLFSTESLLEHARHAGLSLIAITDHNSLDGYIDICNRYICSNNKKAFLNPIVLPGIELSTSFRNTRVHISGLCFDPFAMKIKDILKKIRYGHWERTKLQLENLRKAGVKNINMEIIKNVAGTRIPNWKIIALSLVKSGDSKSIAEARLKFMSKSSPTRISYKDPWPKVQASEAVKVISDAGGISCLNHIGDIFNKLGLSAFKDLLDLLVSNGLVGYEYPQKEGIHLSLPSQAIPILKSYKLMPIHGSDTHSNCFTSKSVSVYSKTFGKFIIQKLKKNYLNYCDQYDLDCTHLIDDRSKAITLKRRPFAWRNNNLLKPKSFNCEDVPVNVLLSTLLAEKLVFIFLETQISTPTSFNSYVNKVYDYIKNNCDQNSNSITAKEIVPASIWQICYRLGAYTTGENIFEKMICYFKPKATSKWKSMWKDYLNRHYNLNYTFLNHAINFYTKSLENKIIENNLISNQDFKIEARVKSPTSCWLKLYQCWADGVYSKIPESQEYIPFIENLLFNYESYIHDTSFSIKALACVIPDLLGLRIIVNNNIGNIEQIKKYFEAITQTLYGSIYDIQTKPRRKHHKRILIWGISDYNGVKIPLEVQIKSHEEYIVGRVLYWHSKGVMVGRKQYLKNLKELENITKNVAFSDIDEASIQKMAISLFEMK